MVSLCVALCRVMSRHFASPRVFFAFCGVGLRFFVTFGDFGSQNGAFWRSLFDKIGSLDEKIDFAKICVFPRENKYFQSFGTNRCELLHKKIDTKSDLKTNCEKMRKKIALGSHFGALGCVLDGSGRVWGGPGASQERPKTAPRAGDDWGASAL